MPTQYKDRVQKLIRLKPSQIDDDERNARRHPTAQQQALREGLAKLGVWNAVIVRKVGKRFRLVDGHLRREELDQPIPALLVDLDEQEAGQALATGDAIGGLAEFDEGKLRALVTEFEMGPATQNMLAELVAEPLDFTGYENPDDRPSGDGASEVIVPPKVPEEHKAGHKMFMPTRGGTPGQFVRIGDYDTKLSDEAYAWFDAEVTRRGGSAKETAQALLEEMFAERMSR